MKAAPEVSGRCHTPLARIAIRVDGGTRFVSTDGVLVVRAQGNYVLLQCESVSYVLHESITAMQEQLEPYGFVRIHRSVMVNRSWVEEIPPRFGWKSDPIFQKAAVLFQHPATAIRPEDRACDLRGMPRSAIPYAGQQATGWPPQKLAGYGPI